MTTITNFAKNITVEATSAGAGMAIGIYTANHDPLNLNDRENQQIAGAVAGGATYAITKGVICGILATPKKIRRAVIGRKAKKMAAEG